ncbi:MAG: ABC transporter ATP-binding protein [Formosimonas sp.]
MSHPILDIQNLSVAFGNPAQPFKAVDQLSLQLAHGEVLAIVGESGSGKSMTMMALMGLISAQGRVTADKMLFNNQDLHRMDAKARRNIIGRDVSMIFQDAMTSLNPSFTVEMQITEVLRTHLGLKGSAARQRVIELLEQVEIPDAKNRMGAYPHQLSGGMSQRVMIAMAIACQPKLLIADEPTTALDVTIQAQIMALLARLQQEHNMSMILITHDLALVAQTAKRVAVMYAGQLVETSRVPDVFKHPAHPYTEALLAAIPDFSLGQRRLHSLAGVVPSQYDRPSGCLLTPRCPYAQEACHTPPPMQASPFGQVRCIHSDISQVSLLESL